MCHLYPYNNVKLLRKFFSIIRHSNVLASGTKNFPLGGVPGGIEPPRAHPVFVQAPPAVTRPGPPALAGPLSLLAGQRSSCTRQTLTSGLSFIALSKQFSYYITKNKHSSVFYFKTVYMLLDCVMYFTTYIPLYVKNKVYTQKNFCIKVLNFAPGIH